MGKPAELRDIDRKVARQIAREIVESVENDEAFPEPFGQASENRWPNSATAEAFEIRLLHMAQLIVEQDPDSKPEAE